NRRDFRGDSGGTGTEPGDQIMAPPQVTGMDGGEPACRPGSVPSRCREAAVIHLGPSLPTVSCGLPAGIGRAALKRSRRPAAEAASPLDLAPGGVYRAASVTCGAGGLLHHRFTLTRQPKLAGGLLSVALSRGSPRVGVTDHPALWSPDLPHQAAKAWRDRPADSPRSQDTAREARYTPARTRGLPHAAPACDRGRLLRSCRSL